MATDTASTRNRVARIIGGANANNNFGGSMTSDFTNGPRNGLIDFTLSSGSGSISAVKIFLYAGSVSTSGNVSCYQLSTAWTQAGVTWNKYDGTNNWTAPGGDYGAAIATTNVTGAGAYFSWDITSLGLTWGNDCNLIFVTAAAQVDYDIATFPPYVEITYTAGGATYRRLATLGVGQ
jgi:hypothetical protein